MKSADSTSITNYVSQVLGANSLLVDLQQVAASESDQPGKGVDLQGIQVEAEISKAPLVFVSMKTPRSSLLTGPAFELFQKIRQAMKLSATDAPLVELDIRVLPESFSLTVLEQALNLKPAPYYIIFSSELASKLDFPRLKEGERHSAEGRQLLCTFDPRVLKSPAKKKEAWEHLKPLKKELGL